MNPAHDQPVNSRHGRLAWLAGELDAQLSRNGGTVVDEPSVVGWYMSYGYSIGFSKSELLHYLTPRPALLAIAESLSEEEISLGKPVPVFAEGEMVEVIVNARNTTYHKGKVRGVSWHHKEAKWYFVLEENGKKVSKRYEASDLRAVVG